MTFAQQEIRLRLIGVAPLLMRSGRLADPLDPHSIALQRSTSKRLKTIADHQMIARLEWRGSLWLAEGRPCVPAEAVEAALVAAGKTLRCGSLVRSAVVVSESPALSYVGPESVEDLYEAGGFVHRCGVRIGTKRLMRTRPMFSDWSLVVSLSYLPPLIDGDTLLEIATLAGRLVGLGDFRPRFGRFRVEPDG